MRPVDVIRKVAPHARPEYVKAFEDGDGLFAAAKVMTPLRLAHFLAQSFLQVVFCDICRVCHITPL